MSLSNVIGAEKEVVPMEAPRLRTGTYSGGQPATRTHVGVRKISRYRIAL